MRKIVLGLVGYGYWGPNLLRNFLECDNAEVKYVCDKSAERLNKVHAKYPFLKTTEDYSVLLNDPEIDGVVIATPISTHFKLAEKALLKHKHVFIEKPLTANSAEAEMLIALAEAKKLTLMVGHTFEYSAPVIKVKELIDQGELGKIYYISSSRINLGQHQSDTSVLWDLAPHDFSMLFYWLGEESSYVSAFGRSCVQPHINDVAFINLSFPSGVIAEVHLSWLAPVKLRRTLIVGDKKMLLYDDTENVEKIKLFDHGVQLVDPNSFGEFQLSYRTGDIVSPRLENSEPLRVEAEHFTDCILTNTKPKTDGYSGLRVVRALEKAELSSIEHQLLSKKDDNGSKSRRKNNGSKKIKVNNFSLGNI